MSTSRTFAELFIPESEHATAARDRADRLGCVPVGQGAATALTFLAAAVQARAVVEIGTGAGRQRPAPVRRDGSRRDAHLDRHRGGDTSGRPSRHSPKPASPPAGRG